MRVICTACLRRLYIAPDKVPADAARFHLVCPQCNTALMVDALHGQTHAEGVSAYALDCDVEQQSPSELVELRAAVERMVGKLRAGMRRPWNDQDFGFIDAYDAEDND